MKRRVTSMHMGACPSALAQATVDIVAGSNQVREIGANGQVEVIHGVVIR